MVFLSFLLASLGAFSTFFLAKHDRLGAIRASTILSIFAYLLFSLIAFQPEFYSTLFFGGTFIGMSAPKRFGVYTLFFTSILFSLLFFYLVTLLNSFGGALGVSAFLSVCICHLAIVLGAPRSRKQN